MAHTTSLETEKPIDLTQPPAAGMVRVTFLPEGRTVEFEYGTMPYEHHGKPMSFLDVAENFGIFLDHACGGVVRLHHVPSLDQGGCIRDQ